MDSTYAPQSPDLSGFLPSPNKQTTPYNHNHNHNHSHNTTSTSYAPRSPNLPPSFTTSSAPQVHQHNQNLHAYTHNSNNQIPTFGGIDDYTGSTSQYMPPIPALPPSHSFDAIPTQGAPPYFGQQSQAQLQAQHINPEPSFNPPHLQSQIPIKSEPSSSTNMSSTTRAPRKGGASSSGGPPAPYKDPNPTHIEIRTKFPVARIKRIMQADEEVGKVAQVTPVAVSKALELFMIALVTGAAEKAKEKGGKRVTAQHLKSVVMERTEEFDFLAEIVGKVAEGQEGAGGEARKRKGSESEEEMEEQGPKKRKGKGRRKKEE